MRLVVRNHFAREDEICATGSAGALSDAGNRDPANRALRAELIKSRVLADFDRVVDTLRGAAALTSGEQKADALTVIEILKEIRDTLVAANPAAGDDGGYLIVDWQDATEQVRRIVARDRASMGKDTDD